MDNSPIIAVAEIFSKVVHLYSLLVLAWIICSWLQVNPANPIVTALRAICDPPMREIRRLLPFVVVGGLDLSPIVLLFGLQLLSNGLLQWSRSLA